MFDLSGKIAVVTGASSGLGIQMATAFAKQGANLAIRARRIERLEELASKLRSEYNVKVLPIKCDVTVTEEIDAAAVAVEQEYGRVDILLNCAGAAKTTLSRRLLTRNGTLRLPPMKRAFSR